MSNRNIQPDMMFVSARRGPSIVCFSDFQGRFSPKKPGFERSEYIELKRPYLRSTFMEESAWDGWKRLAADVVFLFKMEVKNPISAARLS